MEKKRVYGCRRPCLYRHCVGDKCNNAWESCDYMALTGRSRLAQLPSADTTPENCPLFIPSEKVKQARRRNNPQSPPWEPQALAMWAEGATDAEIGQAVGLKESTIATWRRSRSLQINSTYQRPAASVDWAEVRALYDAGQNDGEIAEKVGCSNVHICNWRKREGLPPQGRKDRRGEQREAM